MPPSSASVPHDLVVIGTGPGGYVAAIRAAQSASAWHRGAPALLAAPACSRLHPEDKALLESSEKYAEASTTSPRMA